MKKYIVLMLLVAVLSLWGFDKDFPFGMNNSVYGNFSDTSQAAIKYREKYKASMDSTASGLGIGWWRAQLKFRWNDIETEQSWYRYDDEDSLVKWTGERGMHILPCFGYTAKWAANQSIPEGYWTLYPPLPSYWDDYKEYVQKLVERYDGDGVADFSGLINPIKNWQCMNEPYGKYFLGTPEHYVEMFDSARVAIEGTDSEGKIGGPCLTGVPSNKFYMEYPEMCYWTESMGLPIGWLFYNVNSHIVDTVWFPTWEEMADTIINDMIGIDNVDFVTFHIYNTPHNFMGVFRDLKGIVGQTKPVWITEVGYQWSDPMRIDTRRYPGVNPQGPIKFTPDANGIFWDSVYVLYAWSAPLLFRADTFLCPGDTVHLNFDGKDEYVVYDGGPIRWTDNTIAIDIGDSMNIFHLFEEEYVHNPEKQAENYSGLIDSLISYISSNPESPLKVFFFGAYPFLYVKYYPPIIKSYDGVKRFYLQRLRSPYTIIDTSLVPLPAYDTIFNKINLVSDNDGLKGATGPKIAIDDENFYLAHKKDGDRFVRIPRDVNFWDKRDEISSSTFSPSLYEYSGKLYYATVVDGQGKFCISSNNGESWGDWISIAGANNITSPIHTAHLKVLDPDPYNYWLYTDIYFTYVKGDSIGITKYRNNGTQIHYKANYIQGNSLSNPMSLLDPPIGYTWMEYYIYEDDGTIKMMWKDKIPPVPYVISTSGSCVNSYAAKKDSCGYTTDFYVVWVNTMDSKIKFRRKYRGGSWTDIQDVAILNSSDYEKVQPTVVVYPSGAAGVVWSDMESGKWNVYLSESEGAGWTEKVLLSSGINDCFYPVTWFRDSVTYLAYNKCGSQPVIKYRKLQQGISVDSVHITYLSTTKVAIGYIITVRWECLLSASYTKVYLTRDGGSSWTLLDSLTGDPGEYTWTATSPATSNAHFRIEEYSSGQCKSGTSERFTITDEIPLPPKGPKVKGPEGYEIYGQGDISEELSGVVALNSNNQNDEFGLRKVFHLSPNKEYHLVGFLRNEGNGKIGMGIGEGNNRVKVTEIGGGSGWKKEYAIITTSYELSAPLDIYADSNFSGTGYIGGIKLEDRIPLEVANLIYLTKFGGNIPLL